MPTPSRAPPRRPALPLGDLAVLEVLSGAGFASAVFLIYTTHGVDTEDLNPLYYRAAGEPKAIWKIPEAEHTGGLAARPREYERRVIAFLDRELPEGPRPAP